MKTTKFVLCKILNMWKKKSVKECRSICLYSLMCLRVFRLVCLWILWGCLSVCTVRVSGWSVCVHTCWPAGTSYSFFFFLQVKWKYSEFRVKLISSSCQQHFCLTTRLHCRACRLSSVCVCVCYCSSAKEGGKRVMFSFLSLFLRKIS